MQNKKFFTACLVKFFQFGFNLKGAFLIFMILVQACGDKIQNEKSRSNPITQNSEDMRKNQTQQKTKTITDNPKDTEVKTIEAQSGKPIDIATASSSGFNEPFVANGQKTQPVTSSPNNALNPINPGENDGQKGEQEAPKIVIVSQESQPEILKEIPSKTDYDAESVKNPQYDVAVGVDIKSPEIILENDSKPIVEPTPPPPPAPLPNCQCPAPYQDYRYLVKTYSPRKHDGAFIAQLDAYMPGTLFCQILHKPEVLIVDKNTCAATYFKRREEMFGCFDPTTKILMADGKTEKIITQIQKGEKVYNPILKRGIEVSNTVAGPESNAMFAVTIMKNGLKQTVKVTDSHPFVTKLGAKTASNLKINDEIKFDQDNYFRVTEIETLPIQKAQWVFNLEVSKGSSNYEDHVIVANGIATGDLFMQNDLKRQNNSKNLAKAKK